MKDPQQDIRIGTLVQGTATAGDYVAQIIPHGFESFQLFFWQQIPDDVDLPKVADDIRNAIGERETSSYLRWKSAATHWATGRSIANRSRRGSG